MIPKLNLTDEERIEILSKLLTSLEDDGITCDKRCTALSDVIDILKENTTRDKLCMDDDTAQSVERIKSRHVNEFQNCYEYVRNCISNQGFTPSAWKEWLNTPPPSSYRLHELRLVISRGLVNEGLSAWPDNRLNLIELMLKNQIDHRQELLQVIKNIDASYDIEDIHLYTSDILRPNQE